MNTRKIKAKVKVSNIKKLEKKYTILDDIADVVDITLEVPDDPNSYKALSRDPLIEDWDVLEKESIQPSTPVIVNSQKDSITAEEAEHSFLERCNKYEELSYFIEAAFSFNKTNPFFLFSNKVIDEKIQPIFNQVCKTISVDHTLCRMILESYYGGLEMEAVQADIKDKLNSQWTKMREYKNLSELLDKLYRTV